MSSVSSFIREWLTCEAARSLPGSLADPTCTCGIWWQLIILTNSHICTSLLGKVWTHLMFGLLTVTTELQLRLLPFTVDSFERDNWTTPVLSKRQKQSRRVLTLPQSCQSFYNAQGMYELAHMCVWVGVHCNARGMHMLAHMWVHVQYNVRDVYELAHMSACALQCEGHACAGTHVSAGT